MAELNFPDESKLCPNCGTNTLIRDTERSDFFPVNIPPKETEKKRATLKYLAYYKCSKCGWQRPSADEEETVTIITLK